ncbi:hypothetical protein BC832DRAFT_592097 [Gaertneriomyces semiglobifer]|nr:hypothetical protein BC832DRAFT_592097 [Gaertneriomyces semiglobifer]
MAPLIRTVLTLLAAIWCVTVQVHAGHAVTGAIETNPILKDLSELGPTTVRIDGGRWVTYVDEDGEFEFRDIPEGTHVLEVVNHLWMFIPVRLDISPTAVQASITIPGTSFSKLGPALLVPLHLAPRAKYDFFVPREGFKWSSLLANPMLLMSGVSLLMFFALPKLMANMPEEARQMQQNQPPPQLPTMPDISQNLANWFAPQQAGGRK